MGLFDFLFGIIGIILGGSAVWIFLIKSTKLKARAEALKEVQDVYQETIIDLREDKRILKEERESDRMKHIDLVSQVCNLEKSVFELREELKKMKLQKLKESCVNYECKERIVS